MRRHSTESHRFGPRMNGDRGTGDHNDTVPNEAGSVRFSRYVNSQFFLFKQTKLIEAFYKDLSNLQIPPFFSAFKIPQFCVGKYVHNTYPKILNSHKSSEVKKTLLRKEIKEGADLLIRKELSSWVSNLRFQHVQKASTNVWKFPKFLLRSLQWPAWRVFLKIKDGSHIYPVNYRYPFKDNVFYSPPWSETILVNPPYEEKVSILPFFRPLEDHIAFLVRRAFLTKTNICILVPFRPRTNWFSFIQEHPFCTYILLQNPIAFLQDGKNTRERVAPFQTAIILVGINYPPFRVFNDCFGNFKTPRRFFNEAINVLKQKNLREDIDKLLTYFGKTTAYVSQYFQILKNAFQRQQ